MARPGKGQGKRGQLRIIGGQWRGRNLSFIPEDGLRPTTDRIRETLFNWLAPQIHGARCADLFAGSGALGLEALSEGRRPVRFRRQLCRRSAPNSATLDNPRRRHSRVAATVRRRTVPCTASGEPLTSFSLTRLSAGSCAAPTCSLLQNSGLLAAGALVYVEIASNDSPLDIPPGWSEHRAKTSGGVSYRLFAVD